MAYFLKKSNLKKGVYLQIYESFYSHDKKATAHRSYKVVGYVDELISSGIKDPVSHYSEIVRQMNEQKQITKQREKERQISSSPERIVGYFLLKAVLEDLHVANYLDIMQSPREFRFRIADLLEALIYCRVTEPCSKNKTFNEVLPLLYDQYEFSYDQLLDGIEYMGSEYEKIIEIFNHQRNLKYPANTSVTYFDGTNFYFENDREDSFRKRGPSKENRKDPIVSLGLLLDAHLIPLGMKLYPGNESEKPVIREVIQDLKTRNNITGRTVQVADKGLNCAANILAARKNGDGYLFSKSVKQLPETEKTWLWLEDGYQKVLNEDKTVCYKIKECVDTFPYPYVNDKGKKITVRLTEKRVATFNPKLAEKKKIEILRMVDKATALQAAKAKKNEFGECGKYVSFSPVDKSGKACDGKIAIALNKDAIDEDLSLAGYNLFVTSEVTMTADEIYSTYHNLWRIEETFRVMKSYLDARPVFLQKTDSICGHFLICYLSVLLLRLLQFCVFDNRYSSEKLIGFMKGFRVVEIQHNKFINLASSSDFIKSLSADLRLPLTNYFLDSSQINKVLSCKF